MLTALTDLVVKSSEKNTCTRALWVISKQNFHADIIGKKVRFTKCDLSRSRKKRMCSNKYSCSAAWFVIRIVARCDWILCLSDWIDWICVQVPDILTVLEAVRNREDIQSVVMEHEAINVIIRFVDHSTVVHLYRP